MITITLPEWLVWLFIGLSVFSVATSVTLIVLRTKSLRLDWMLVKGRIRAVAEDIVRREEL